MYHVVSPPATHGGFTRVALRPGGIRLQHVRQNLGEHKLRAALTRSLTPRAQLQGAGCGAEESVQVSARSGMLCAGCDCGQIPKSLALKRVRS
jgi:hypothetical protein